MEFEETPSNEIKSPQGFPEESDVSVCWWKFSIFSDISVFFWWLLQGSCVSRLIFSEDSLILCFFLVCLPFIPPFLFGWHLGSIFRPQQLESSFLEPRALHWQRIWKYQRCSYFYKQNWGFTNAFRYRGKPRSGVRSWFWFFDFLKIFEILEFW